MKRVIDSKVMQVMALFDKITHADLRDCILGEGSVLFIVEENQVGKAIGKQGVNSRKLEKALKRKVKIVEYNAEVTTFVKNLFYPLKAADVKLEDGVVYVYPVDTQTRGQMIGRNASTLRNVESIAKRYFKINEIKIEKWSRNQEA